MSYAENQSDMEDIWEWVLHYYPKEDQVVARMPKTENDYDLTISLLPTPISADEEPFKMRKNPVRRISLAMRLVEYL